MPDGTIPGANTVKHRFFPGWLVVAGAFGVMCVGFGAAYTFGTVVEALQGEFGVSRGSVSLVFSLAGFLYFLLGAASGPVADRIEPRWVCLAGMAIVALGLFLASHATTILQVYLAYGLGIGVGVGLSYTPSIGAVQPWFTRRRGFASGLAVSGIGVGTLLAPPLAALLVDAQGWRGAYAVLAGIALALGGAAALLLRGAPARYGLSPEAGGATPVRPGGGAGLAEAVRSRPFRLLYGATLASSFGVFMPFVHIVAYAESKGVPRTTAVLLLSLIGIGSTAGRFFLGGLADRLGRRRSLALLFLAMGVSLACWALASRGWELALFALAFGTFYGGFVALLPAIIADHFGMRNATGIIGALYTSVAFGTLIGPTLAGYAFDLTGSYAVPIAASAVLTLLAGAAIWNIEEPARAT
jgi:MFS family permease